MNLVVKDNEVVRVDPAENGPNSETLCVKGKFGYRFINSPDRLSRDPKTVFYRRLVGRGPGPGGGKNQIRQGRSRTGQPRSP